MCESDFVTLHNTSVNLVGTLESFQKNRELSGFAQHTHTKECETVLPIGKLSELGVLTEVTGTV